LSLFAMGASVREACFRSYKDTGVP